jgi:hypothetical protein
MACIVPGCKNDAPNNFGVRLRRPNTSAIWAPNTNASVCDQHATQGVRVRVTLDFTQTQQVETNVSAAGGPIASRTTPINHKDDD